VAARSLSQFSAKNKRRLRKTGVQAVCTTNTYGLKAFNEDEYMMLTGYAKHFTIIISVYVA